ncbi:MAG: choice-of-anchor Q domain-containing protein [Pseudobdellovibrionaceae bacterium]
MDTVAKPHTLKYRLASALSILFFAVTMSVTMSFTANAANWYVDNTVATSGSGQSWATAFKNFSNITWSSINPGDTLYISGGTTSQTYTEGLSIGNSGNSTSRIFVRVGQDVGHAGTVILDGAGIFIGYVSYITIDGSVAGAQHLKIQNVTSANKDDGVAISNGGSGGVGIRISNVTITNCNNGINLTYGDLFEVDHNNITIIGDHGINYYANPLHSWGANLIHDNTITSLDNTGFGGADSIQPGNSSDIYNNTFYAVESTAALAGQHPDTLQLGGRYTRIYNNTFINVGDSNIDFDAMGSGVIQDLYIYNNLFHITTQVDNYPDFIRMYSTGMAINTFSNVKILNNTFIDNIGGVQLIGIDFANGTGAGAGNEIKNNLAKGSTSMGLNIGSGGGSFVLSLSNNIYPNKQATDPTAIIGVPSLDANFVPTAMDTLAKDHGTTLSYFTTDKLGTPRPQGPAWDIGAFEYSSTGTLTLAAPKNLRVQ